jgi:hypothetical protein
MHFLWPVNREILEPHLGVDRSSTAPSLARPFFTLSVAFPKDRSGVRDGRWPTPFDPLLFLGAALNADD